jgi:ADP-ribose pyrophosphatase YjhB (NUDIX family)
VARKASPVALAIIRNGAKILVSVGFDSFTRETYYRPLGGGIKFGERSEDAIRRELREELDAAVKSARLIGVLENTFRVGPAQGHEIDFIYEVVLADAHRFRRGPIRAAESNGAPIPCEWKALMEFRKGARLYPSGLLPLIDARSVESN